MSEQHVRARSKHDANMIEASTRLIFSSRLPRNTPRVVIFYDVYEHWGRGLKGGNAEELTLNKRRRRFHHTSTVCQSAFRK